MRFFVVINAQVHGLGIHHCMNCENNPMVNGAKDGMMNARFCAWKPYLQSCSSCRPCSNPHNSTVDVITKGNMEQLHTHCPLAGLHEITGLHTPSNLVRNVLPPKISFLCHFQGCNPLSAPNGEKNVTRSCNTPSPFENSLDPPIGLCKE